MTGPFQGNASDDYYRQLATFNAQRDEFYKNFFNQTSVAGQVTGMQRPTGVPFQGPTVTQQSTANVPPMETWHDADLLGAAKFWGIPEEAASQMPRDALIAHLNQLRSAARPSEDSAMQRLQDAGMFLASVPAMAAVGAGEAITGGIANLPFVGGSLAKLAPIHAADQWFRSLEEGIRASNPADMQLGLTGANVVGNFAAMWYPAAGAWTLAGKALGGTAMLADGTTVARGIFKGSPIARGALQGLLSSEALEGGSEHPLSAGAFGAVLGGSAGALARPAVQEYLQAAANKITNRFVSPAVLESMGPELPGTPLNRMEGASDISRVASAAMQGDENAIAAMNELQRTGKLPVQETTYRPDPFAETSARQERGFFPNGYPFKGMNAQTAETAALQMNKAGTIIESPMLPQAVKSTMPNELTVAFAAQSSNPGGSNVIEGILDPAGFDALGDNVAFATRKGRLAAIVSDQPVTPKMVAEFEQHGMYTGQRVIGPAGRELEITGINGDVDQASVIPVYGGVEHVVTLSRLGPNTQSPGVHAVPQLWDEFNQFADMQTTMTQAAMGGALQPEQLQTIKVNSMQQWMEDFMDNIGVQKPGDRARIKNYFNQRWVEDVSSAHPEEKAQNLAGQAGLAEAINSHPPTALGQVDDLAGSKGFVALPDGEGGWVLKDAVNSTSTQPIAMRFSDLDAANEFLGKLNRELPDLTPNTPVPGELAGVLTREPPPEINVNHRFPAQVSESVMDMGGGGVPPVNPIEVQEARGDGNFGRLNNLWKDGFMRWEPARRVFAKVSDAVRQTAGHDFGVAGVYDDIGVKLNQHHTAMAPFQNELAEVFKGTHMGSTKRLLNGEWIDTWSIQDPAARLARAQSLGWGDKDIASLTSFDQLLAKIHPAEQPLGSIVQAQSAAPDELRQLVTYARQQRSLGENPWTGFQVGTTTADFYNVAKGADFGLREMDPRRLGDAYIRSVFWQRDMAESFNAAKETANQLKQVTQLKDVGHFLDNWLDVVKNGYRPEDDIALDGIHALGRAVLGKSFSRQQARELISMGLNTTHASFLGYRVHVMARDALQLFFAMPRAGKELPEVITKFTTNPEFRRNIWEEVFREGAATAVMPTMASPGALAGELEAANAGMATAGMSRRMAALGSVTGAVRDAAPDFMKGSSESVLKPLYLYSKQGQMMKTLVYKAGQLKAERALEAFRNGGTLEELMGASGARTYDRAWQEQFKQLVASGDDTKAAQFLGRQLADATQFKYGVAENPAVSRTMTGRLFMQMGSYQTQYLQYLRESLTNGTYADRAKMVLMAGAVSAGLESASRETGWNFRWMNPYMIGFFGGPWVSTGASMLQGGQAMARTLQGDGNVTPGNSRIMDAGMQAAGSAAAALNPLNGLYATATGLGSAINDSPTPGAAIGRLMVTGERGALPDILNSIGIEQFQPTSNPVRMDGLGLPYTPQLEPTYPAGANMQQNGYAGSGYVPPPDVTPVPGGGAASARPNQEPDSTVIPFTAHPQPYAPSGYDVTMVQDFLISQQSGAPAVRDWTKVFLPEDLQLLKSLDGMPVQQAFSIFKDQVTQRVQAEANRNGRQPTGSYHPGNPGSGGMF